MEELFSIHVKITEACSLKSDHGSVNQILFTGECHAPFFTGVILPGGVDTQISSRDGACLLSARYMLEGTDNTGKPAKIYIENNGDMSKTHPRIITDNESLRWLETTPLQGRITGWEHGVDLHFSKENECA